MKRKPTGYVAVCQCGVVVGAMDKDRTTTDDASRLLGRWLSSGCTVKPMFDTAWRAQIEPCQCSDGDEQQSVQSDSKDTREHKAYRRGFGHGHDMGHASAQQAAQGEPAEHWHRLYLEKCQQYNDRVAQLGSEILTSDLQG